MEQLSFFEDQLRPTMAFAELTELYFTHYAEQNLKANTRTNYRYITDRFLLPSFGALPLSSFNNLMLTRWFSQLPVSPSYCKNIYTVLRSMFTLAIHHGFIPTHPCDYVVLPRIPVSAEERCPRLTAGQAKELFDMTEDFSWFTSVVRFLLLTGVRSGEAFGLRWEDVDFERQTIYIRRNLAIRQIAMSSETILLLLIQRREQTRWMLHAGVDLESKAGSAHFTGSPAFPHPEMVFTTPKGNFIDHNYTERKFKQFVAGTSFSDVTLHSLRHANATLMLAAGVDLKVVSTLLGHSSIATTANLYTEVLDSTKAEAARMLLEQLDRE